VQEDDGLAAVQFREDRVQALVPQIPAVGVGQEHHAVGAEGVDGVADLGECCVHVG
jgi:hypothetical protein